MRSGKKSEAIIVATTAHQPLATTRRNTRSSQALPPKEKAIYFHTCLYDMSDPDEPEQVEKLQAGKTYLLAITCEPHRSTINKHLVQDGRALAGNFTLILAYDYNNASVTTPITPAKEKFSFQGIFNGEFTREFTLPPDFPTCNLSITLELKTPQRPLPMLVVRYTLPAYGQQRVLDMEIFRVSRINQGLPENTAILLVEAVAQRAVHKQAIRLRGWGETGLQLDEASVLMKTIVSIENLQAYRQKKKVKLSPEALLKSLTKFSRTNSPRLLTG